MPSSRVAFWTEKFRRNVERDADVVAALRMLGWRVGVVWECEILGDNRAALIERVTAFLDDPHDAGLA